MSYTLKEIVEGINKDITYHENMFRRYPELSADWNFHLGWVDALTSYRWKLKLLLEQE